MNSHKIDDLNIEKDILLPFFDFTININSKQVLQNIFLNPLNSKDDIIARQKIIQGFILNNNVLESYNYSFLSFNKVYTFLSTWQMPIFNNLFFLNSDKYLVNKLRDNIQLTLLFFDKLEKYINALDINAFPEMYRVDIYFIKEFIRRFRLDDYVRIIKERRLNKKQIKIVSQTIEDVKRLNIIYKFWEHLFRFEAFLSISKGIVKHKFNFPEISDTILDLKLFYHPSISKPVKNNLKITQGVIVLNGPNMSGKSTFLKAISICTILGNLGIAIPADKNSKIPFSSYFSICINKTDILSSGYSHFMNEIVNLKQTLIHAKNGNSCFAVFDELFNGTDIDDAKYLIDLVLKGLANFNKGFFFISTHIKRLNNFDNNKISFYNMLCKLNNDKPELTYKIEEGWSTIKIGKILFNNEGIHDLLKP